MALRVPPPIDTRLHTDRHLSGVVDTCLAEFEKWFYDSKLPFFPDFTDHKTKHVENVLATAVALIRDHSQTATTNAPHPSLTAADAAALILATLFHDSAMHLTEASFFAVIRGDASSRKIAGLDSVSWPELWDRFYFSAHRWTQRRRLDVFGATKAGTPRAEIRDPFEHWDNLLEGDKRLIGEFIRTYHGRLAHEFVVYNIPGWRGPTFELKEGLSDNFRELVGLIARSHTMPIRPCVDYLVGRFGLTREIEGVHAVFLMTLLRVSDYLQIDRSRSPDVVFRYKSIPSAVSTLEHEATQAVRDIIALHDDPESLQVNAQPKTARTFLRISEWVEGIQAELDASWAVLGEVYGRFAPLNELGLKYRRIRSNLDDLQRFREHVNYVPARIRFDVVRPDLLTLLVGPLYGDEPSFGVRELIQNAVDAVREHDNYAQRHPNRMNIPRRDQEYDVVITLSPPNAYGYANLIVSDRGIGMTEEILNEYFLRAGASFRSSEWWKSEFEPKLPHEERPLSVVLRSGRFGIGALAAFLIGRQITCETRHVTAREGLRFSATLESDVIEVIRDENIPLGTSIAVQVKKETHHNLFHSGGTASRPELWDWYCFDYPTVSRSRGSGKLEPNKYSFDSELRTGHWRHLQFPLPYEVHWTFDPSPRLTCNGIFVSDSPSLISVPPKHFRRQPGFNLISYPNVSILDPDACFPLRLQRDGLRPADYPFGEALSRDVLVDLIAWLFFHGPTNQFPVDSKALQLTPWVNRDLSDQLLVLAPQGYGLRIATLLNGYSARNVLFVRGDFKLLGSSDSDVVVFAGQWDERDSSRAMPLRVMSSGQMLVAPKHDIHICSFSADYSRYIEETRAMKPGDVVKWRGKEYFVDLVDGAWQILISSKGLALHTRLGPTPAAPGLSGVFLSEVILPKYSTFGMNGWYLDNLWQQFFGKEWIPYNLADRLAQFPHAAQTLHRYYTGSAAEKP